MKRREIPKLHMPAHGLEWGPQTKVRILIMRGEGRLTYQGYRVEDYPSKDFLLVTRDGGDAHVCCEDLCDCVGFSFKNDCSHCKIIRAIADVQAIKKGFSWFRESEEDPNG